MAADTGWASVMVAVVLCAAFALAARISASERIGQSQSSANRWVSLRRLPRGFLLRAVRLRTFLASIDPWPTCTRSPPASRRFSPGSGSRSTYILHARTAASSTNAWHLKRPSQKRPLHSVLLIRATSHPFLQPPHEPRQARKPPAVFPRSRRRPTLRHPSPAASAPPPSRPSCSAASETSATTAGQPPRPTTSRPDPAACVPRRGCDLTEYGVVAEFNGHALDQQLQPVANPVLPMTEVASRHGVLSTEEGPPDAPRHAMINPDLAFNDDVLPSELRHFTPPAGEPMLK